MKILMFGRGIPSRKYPLNGIFEFDQAKALAEKGVDIIYVAIDMRSIFKKRRFGITEEIVDGVLTYNLNIPVGGLPYSIREIIVKGAVYILYKRITKKNGQPAIVHTHFLMVAHTIVDALRNEPIYFVHTEHWSELNSNNLSEKHLELGRETYALTSTVISVSQALSNNLRDKFSVNSVIIPNIIDFKTFTTVNPKLNRPSESFQFISVGRLEEQKGFDLLLKSFNKAFGKNNNVSLKIIGEGSKKDELLSYIKANNLENRVSLLGVLSREEIASHFAQSDAFALASRFETFGVVFAEAIASGLPVIGTRCGGPEYFITPQNGILVDSDNLEDFSNALTEMVNKVSTFDTKRNSIRIAHEFSSDKITTNIIQLYRQIIDGRNNEKRIIQ